MEGTARNWPHLKVMVVAGVLLMGWLCLLQAQQCQGVEMVTEDLKSNEEDLSFLDEDEGSNPSEAAIIADALEGEAEPDEQQGRQEDEEDREFDEEDVIVLGSGNFSEFVKTNLYVLVEFYAPWCGHCKALAPEYAEAATILKGKAVLAKVDATTNEKLAEKYGIDSFPTILFFLEGKHKPYYGGRVKNEIVDWVKRKVGPSVYPLESSKDAEFVLSLETTVAIALFDSLQGFDSKEYTAAARQVDRVYFFETEIADVAELFGFSLDVKRPALVLLKQEAEQVSWFDGPFNRDSIEAFVTENKLPLVTTFNKATAALIFESPVKKQVILFTSSQDYKKLISDFTKAAKALKGKLVFVHADLDDSEQAPGILEFFDIPSDKPTVVGYEAEENGRKFLFQGDIIAENVKAFGEDFLADRLKPHLKSDPIPEMSYDNNVKVVVGLNFDNVVLDETKDVFVEIYAPWCGYCQQLRSTWEKLARRLKGVESIVIAKMDGTTNELGAVKAENYPTLLLFPAGKHHGEPIVFEGDRTVKGFVKFLKKEATIPFTVPRSPDGLTKRDDIEATAGVNLESVNGNSLWEKDEL